MKRIHHIALLALSVAVSAAIAAWIEGTTRPPEITPPQSSFASQAQLLDRHGQVLHIMRVDSTQRRMDWVPLEQVSPALSAAVLRAEDQRFYSHGGVDVLALMGASWSNLVGSQRRGASTLTMQLTGLLEPSLKPSGRRSWREKLTQMRAAWRLEQQLGKSQILEAYLNLAPFRGELVGVGAAASGLFGKHASGLNAQEAAVLASLLPSPQARPAQVAKRACRLLANNCVAQDLPLAGLSRPRFFADHEQLAPHAARKLLSSAKAGDTISSTLDKPTQRLALNALSEQMRELARRGAEDGAVVVLDNASGAVLAYVGSSGQFSQASEVDAAAAVRQAGSTLKPFLYGLAIEQRRLTAASLLDDSPLAIKTADAQYLPRNYSTQFQGWVSVRRALASSLNVPAVRTLAMLDPDQFVQHLRAVGLPSVSKDGDFYGYSLALGSADVSLLELTNAYRTLANKGQYSPLAWHAGVKGEQQTRTQVMHPGAAHIITHILSDNEARAASFGLDSALRLPFLAAVKTGTSKDMRDNWCIGFSQAFTVGVWVGNASGAPMRGVSGVSGAAPIWHAVMAQLGAGQALAEAKDASAVAQRVRFYGGLEAERLELFMPGTQVSEVRLASQDSGIVHPLNGALYAMDPDIPARRQTLWFTQTVGAKAQWVLNGEKLSRAQRYGWRLQPGKHHLVLVDSTQRHELRFEVRAAAKSRVF
jgi:penicillin-binding protein 1C